MIKLEVDFRFSADTIEYLIQVYLTFTRIINVQYLTRLWIDTDKYWADRKMVSLQIVVKLDFDRGDLALVCIR